MIKHKLCGIETVCSMNGLPPERVYERVDQGNYLWVWNVSLAPDAYRELRFWSEEINCGRAEALEIGTVIRRLVPDRSVLPGQFDGLRQWELCNLLRIGRNHLALLHRELPQLRTERGVYVRRPAIENFLKRRWCGAMYET